MYGKMIVAVWTVLSLNGSLAWAQDAAAAPPTTAAAATPAVPVVQDGPRFRSGISLGGGIEKVSIASGGMFGIDGRLGLQWNDLLGFYVQPHLSFGSLSVDPGMTSGVGVSGGTGTFSIAAMAEATLVDRFFAGAGFGYGVLNNPSGPMVQARAGGYLMSSRDEGIRRKGLMLGVDIRAIFVDGATGYLVLGSVGWEKY
jgi:hypothetical protein